MDCSLTCRRTMINDVDEGLQTLHERVFAPGVDDILHHLTEDLRLLGENGVDGGNYKLHQVPIAVEVVDDVHQSLDVDLGVLAQKSLLLWLGFGRELREQLDGARLEVLLILREIGEAELGSVAGFEEARILTVEGGRIVMKFLGVLFDHRHRYQIQFNSSQHAPESVSRFRGRCCPVIAQS